MDSSRFLIIGANGQLGKALQERYPAAQAVDSAELDITNLDEVRGYDWSGVDVILNAAAYTNVDGAETAEGRVAAWSVNAVGPANLANVAIANNLKLVHISTDYVFDGTNENHPETESFSPLSVYGQSKAAGDIAVGLVPQHFILRTTWVIGEGKNFVRTMLGLGERGIAPTVVSDQVGRLTFTSEIVNAIDHVLSSSVDFGTYNVTNSGEPASWADVTRAIFSAAGYDLAVGDTSTEEYFAGKEGIAPRPLNSIMNLDKLAAAGYTPRDWHEDLADYIKKEQA
jgi:dTDP-4-dehydrorhamnose 3,5-epimerase/reductase